MDYKLLENAPLFKDVPPEEINVMLQCLGTEERKKRNTKKARSSSTPEM